MKRHTRKSQTKIIFKAKRENFLRFVVFVLAKIVNIFLIVIFAQVVLCCNTRAVDILCFAVINCKLLQTSKLFHSRIVRRTQEERFLRSAGVNFTAKLSKWLYGPLNIPVLWRQKELLLAVNRTLASCLGAVPPHRRTSLFHGTRYLSPSGTGKNSEKII